jgi:carbon-monoxide dehydrogenase medium subunit
VGDLAYRARRVEEKLLGQIPTPELVDEAARLAAEDGEMGSDLFASAEYRRHLSQVYTKKALQQVML